MQLKSKKHPILFQKLSIKKIKKHILQNFLGQISFIITWLYIHWLRIVGCLIFNKGILDPINKNWHGIFI